MALLCRLRAWRAWHLRSLTPPFSSRAINFNKNVYLMGEDLFPKEIEMANTRTIKI
jgi:hypothetical protein